MLDEAERRLCQSRKMEALCRLAGGAAHDFNNHLTTILGYCEMMQLAMPEADPRREDLGEIKNAADRAAALARQLLAFSRRQILQPRALDVNALLKECEQTLRRLLGKDVELVLNLAPDLRGVKADPGQLTHAILNLAANARDAMPKGGRLLIETRNAVLDEGALARHDLAAPGPYVRIEVSDTGGGMTPEVQDRLFEPFYTTKGRGKGVGLGLSVAYGVIKQSNGSLQVRSEPGKGTSLKIHLPAADDRPQAAPAAGHDEATRGTETILLVDDEEPVRRMIARVLQGQGYTVLAAENGASALGMLADPAVRADLVISDLAMPNMGGRELAQKLLEIRPKLRVVFMSGDAEDPSAAGGAPDDDAARIQKPVSPQELLRLVRRELDKPTTRRA